MDILAQVNEINFEGQGVLQESFLAASIKNIGNVTAIVNGVILKAGEAKGYPFVGKGYKEVFYDSKTSISRIIQII